MPKKKDNKGNNHSVPSTPSIPEETGTLKNEADEIREKLKDMSTNVVEDSKWFVVS
jgi:hypothetical protein